MSKNIYYKRLEVFWKSENYKDANEFAKAIGFKRSENIKRLERSEKAKPGIDILEAIVLKFPNFNTNHFVTGDVSFLENKYEKKHNPQSNAEPIPPYTSPCTNPVCKKRISELESDKATLTEFNNFLKLKLEEGDSPPGKKAKGGMEESLSGTG